MKINLNRINSVYGLLHNPTDMLKCFTTIELAIKFA